ncbi:MAG: hypothetical protein ABI904_21375 [Chloroflexota bacterium]
MKRTVSLFFVCILFVVSCAPVLLPFSTKTPLVTKPSPNPTSVVTAVTQSPTETNLNSEQSVISPQLVNNCPEKQIVLFEDLGLPKNLRLLLLPNTVESYPQIPGKPLSISSENPSPTTIFDDELYDYSVSPDHKWIYFGRPSVDEKYSVLWISSLDGRKQWPIIELGGKGYAGYASWVSEQEVFIIGSPHENEISALNLWEYMPFMSVNPFTLEQRPLTYLARNQQEGLFYYGAVSLDNRSFGMYGRLNRVDFVYDYENDKKLPAFLWLETVNPSDIQFTPIWVYGDGKFAVTITRPDGIDLAFNLDIQSARENKQYNDVMERIIFPERLLPSLVLGIVPVENLIALQRFDRFNSSQSGKWFYVLDYKNKIIYDYCLDLKDSVMRVKFSPDGKFIAFSLDNFTTNLEPDQHYIVILNLESGTIAYLKEYTLVDWGVVTP